MAMAVVAELRERGVPIRDIIVTARDIEHYESVLVRAAIRYGITPTVWTQLPLADTDPYVLCRDLCLLLSADEVTIEAVLRPLEAGWVPTSPSTAWPIDSATLRRVAHHAPEQSMSVQEWCEWFTTSTGADKQFGTYLDWVVEQPTSPAATAGCQILVDVLDRYDDLVLPQVKERDGPALLETERKARAVVRMSEVVERVEGKYAEWLAANRTEQAWETIAQMCESFATQRPGRREHANATALDVIEANDAWGRQVPYVIAVGLTDGVWPQETDPLVPVEFQERILSGHEACQHLAPRAAWAELRDYDQFADVMAAATQGLIVTRHTRTYDGIEQPRSPLLSSVDVERVSQSAASGLLHTDRQIPDDLARLLPDQETAAPTEEIE
jgi:ATP-dependent helicase/nuclease subunit B